jgi:hypothetical protein
MPARPGSGERREENHAAWEARDPRGAIKAKADFATGRSQSGAKPRGHLKSDARRGGGTHNR